MKPLNLLKFILLTLFFISFSNVRADYFAYVPDTTNKILHIYNVTQEVYVTKLSLFGNPRNIYVNRGGSKIFVSTVVLDTSGSVSYINIINAYNNELEANGLEIISGLNIRGLVTSQDDSILFVTHELGVTKMQSPGVLNTLTDIDTTYRGMNIILSDDDKYLFVIGSDNSNNEGISVIDVDSFDEIATLALGTGKGASEIVFNNNLSDPKLFITLSQSDQVISVKISNYGVVNSMSLALFKERDFKIDSNPIDLQLNKNNTELLVVLNYIKNAGGTGNGNVVLLDAKDISIANTVSGISEIFFSNEKSTYSQGPVIHPLALNIDENGNIYVLKQIWSDTTGVYVTKLEDRTSRSSGKRTIDEVQSFNLGNKVSTIANGQFLGPDCEACPTGVEDVLEAVERPAVINFTTILLLPLFIILFRRYKISCK